MGLRKGIALLAVAALALPPKQWYAPRRWNRESGSGARGALRVQGPACWNAVMLPKAIVAAIWVLSLAAWLLPWSGVLGTVLRWTGPFMAVAHVIEFVVYREVFAKAGGATASHFWNTLIFGVFHINPLRESLESVSPPSP